MMLLLFWCMAASNLKVHYPLSYSSINFASSFFNYMLGGDGLAISKTISLGKISPQEVF